MSKSSAFVFKPEDAWVTWVLMGCGTVMVACYVPDYIGPVGLVWGHMAGRGTAKVQSFDVIHSYTMPFARRQGVRTRLNQAIFQDLDCDVILTQDGSEEGGGQFLLASGYTLHKGTGKWYLTKKKWASQQKKNKQA